MVIFEEVSMEFEVKKKEGNSAALVLRRFLEACLSRTILFMAEFRVNSQDHVTAVTYARLTSE